MTEKTAAVGGITSTSMLTANAAAPMEKPQPQILAPDLQQLNAKTDLSRQLVPILLLISDEK
jgi:hypothetical protein